MADIDKTAADEIILESMQFDNERDTYEMGIWKRLQKQLEAGELLGKDLPAEFSEMMRFVDAASAPGQAFQEYMEGLTLKLLPGWDFARYPIRFLLSGSEEINAGVMSAYKPALMYFTKGLLEFVGNNENMLLHTLGHELGHELFREAVGLVRVTKSEEAAVNMPVLQWMYEQGIDPRPAVNLALKLKKVNEARKETNDELQYDMREIACAIFDEHLSEALDVDTLNSVLVAFQNQVAGDFSDRRLLTIPEPMQDIFRTMEYVSPIERAKAGLAPSFEEMTREDQLSFLCAQAETIKEGHVIDRAKAIAALLKTVATPVDEVSKAAGEAMIASLKETPFAFRELYPEITVHLLGQPANTPAGPLRKLMPAMARVLQAASYDDFCAKAQVMADRVSNMQSYPLKYVTWPPSYHLPEEKTLAYVGNKGVPLPWNQQVSWAVQALGEGNEIPARALVLLGIEDERLYAAMPGALLEHVYKGIFSASEAYGFRSTSKMIVDILGNSTIPSLPPVTRPSRPLADYGVAFGLESGTLYPQWVGKDKWDPLEILEREISIRRARMPSQTLEPEAVIHYRFDGTLPYDDEIGFEHWFNDNSAFIAPPPHSEK